MSDSSSLDSLLHEGAARRAAGLPCSAEDLCAGRPELLGPLRQAVRDLESMEAFVARQERAAAGPAWPSTVAAGGKESPGPDPLATTPPAHGGGGQGGGLAPAGYEV